VYLSLCQYHMVFVTTKYNSSYGIVIPPACFFLLRIALAIQGPLCIRINFRFFSIYEKNFIGIVMGIALSL
jgi:hypothetical protein